MINDIPQSSLEAERKGITHYLGNVRCPVHNTRAYWAKTRMCMACVDFEGKPYMQRVGFIPVALPQEEEKKKKESVHFKEFTKEELENYKIFTKKGYSRAEALEMIGKKQKSS